MRNYWIQKTWKLEMREIRGDFHNKIEFAYGPYKYELEPIDLSDLRDQNGLDASEEVCMIVVTELMFQYGVQNTHRWCCLSVRDKCRILSVIRALRAKQPYKHLLDS